MMEEQTVDTEEEFDQSGFTLLTGVCRGQQHSFVEIDREIFSIFSMVILSLPLIQEG